MKTITICQRKGGNGKSTSCLNLARCLSLKGKRVLIIDLDDQKNSSGSVPVTEEIHHTVEDVVTDERIGVRESVVKTSWEGVSLLAGSAHLSGAIKELDGEVGSHLVLKEKLEREAEQYDICLIDTSPSLNILVVNALCASEYVFIPLSSKYFSLQGLGQTIESIQKVQKRLNQALRILGIAFVIYDGRSRLSKEVVSKAGEEYTPYMCRSVINQNVRVEEAQVMQMSIIDYKESDRGAVQYKALCEELLQRMEA